MRVILKTPRQRRVGSVGSECRVGRAGPAGEARAALRVHPLAGPDDWQAAITMLYDDAAFREERYAAVVVLRTPRYAAHLRAAMPLMEHLLRTGAWWDLVDSVAPAAGAALCRDRVVVEPLVRSWIGDPDRWLRRAAIICQLGARGATDTRLLTDAIAANLPPTPGTQDFFIRKAIGWALREHGKKDPEFVKRFVQDHPALTPLSRREALRLLS
ncbi:MAG: DNA alkylation repair protein [Austwickia sp.]|nr:DNA alkylation repair protein [Austwickia sp.]